MNPVDERAGLLHKAGSFYYKIVAEEEIKKVQRLAHLTCTCRAFRQLSNSQDLVLSGGYFEDNWKVIRFKDSDIRYYGTDRALQQRYRISYKGEDAISVPEYLTIRDHFLPTVDGNKAYLRYGLDFNDINNLLAVRGTGTTPVTATGYTLNYSTNDQYPAGSTVENANYVPQTPVNDGGRSYCPNNGLFVIGDGTNPIDGVNFEEGFSIGLYLYNKANQTWKDAFMFKINNTQLKVELNAAGSWVLFDQNESQNYLGLNKTPLFSAGTKEWHHLGLTFKGRTVQIFKDGSFVSLVEMAEAPSYTLSMLCGSSSTHKPSQNSIFVDDVVLYSGVLSSSAFKTLCRSPFPDEFEATGLSVDFNPLLAPGGADDVILPRDVQLQFGLDIPKDIYVLSIELEGGKMLYHGVDFQSVYGHINFTENPIKVLGGMRFMARTYVERKRNLYSYTLGVDDVYGPVDRIMEYYRRNQSPKAFYMAAAQASGMPVVRVESTVLGVVPLHEGKAYMTTSGRYDAPFPHNWLRKGDTLPAGYVIGGEDLFQMFGPHDPVPEGLEGLELRDSCPVPGIMLPNREGQLFVDGHYKPACEGAETAVQAYWNYLAGMPAPDGDQPATGNAMLYLLTNILPHRYIIVRVNENVMLAGMQLRLYEFLRQHRPLGSVLLYAPIERRIVEES